MKSLEGAILARTLGFAEGWLAYLTNFLIILLKITRTYSGSLLKLQKNSHCNYLSLHSYLRAAIGCIFAAVLAG